MRTAWTSLASAFVLLFVTTLSARSVFAITGEGEEATPTSIRIEEPARGSSSLIGQTFTFALGAFAPESLAVGNGTYHFDYGSRTQAYQAQMSWALKLFELLAGGYYFETTLAFSTLTGTADHAPGSDLATASYTVALGGIDTRLLYAGGWFPWRPLVPFVDGGYRYTMYYQPGASGLESAQGGIGNFVAGAGLRLWLNRGSSMAGGTPVFITGKVDRIFPRENEVNLASTSFYGGLTLGL